MEHTRHQAEPPAVSDDPAARDLLRLAFAKTYRWDREFAGFTAAVECLGDRTRVTGRLTARLPDKPELTMEDEEMRKWAQGQFGSIVTHRAARSFDEGDGRFVLTCGEEDAHPLGRLILIHGDGMHSRYRVRDGRILQINRAMGPMAFSINVQDTVAVTDGRHLVSRYLVLYFSSEGGQLTQVESYEDTYLPVGGVYLPQRRHVVFAGRTEAIHRTLHLTDHRLL